ncbi:hypothetical protein NEPTK9_001763 [Candidatus Neptunochlamydia vexilliferae]|uniref:Uncharacterized protein n=1 Tax=Candidatus Neptunichlamydia vexilliferae TaxID=1651774 RepID=A0ABS0B1G2_9BACT|nr:hypothetical protein [Candidatus Neptunochlamydia vexilliferae]
MSGADIVELLEVAQRFFSGEGGTPDPARSLFEDRPSITCSPLGEAPAITASDCKANKAESNYACFRTPAKSKSYPCQPGKCTERIN